MTIQMSPLSEYCVGAVIAIKDAPLGLARFLTILARITAAVQVRTVKWNEYIG